MTPPQPLHALPVDRAVTLSDIARATVENAGVHDTVAKQLTGLQEWVRQQQSLSRQGR